QGGGGGHRRLEKADLELPRLRRGRTLVLDLLFLLFLLLRLLLGLLVLDFGLLPVLVRVLFALVRLLGAALVLVRAQVARQHLGRARSLAAVAHVHSFLGARGRQQVPDGNGQQQQDGRRPADQDQAIGPVADLE